ncbi:hypothetical protein [Actinomadura algeriensis]|uniref:GrpE protein n=1 Tax=Actinomadura algeriensis TaxID=1679523 RepID=A0ABR9K2V2_9ACTN|nr:hypothetical protein [Actinomadura algeriensis]MBE1537043.1 hypothetical protein [Actinomadura algeriensis]
MLGRKRWKHLSDALDRIERRQDRVWTALLIKDPGAPAAVEAYDGLRKQVAAAASARFTHLTQLVQFDVAVAADPAPDTLAKLVDGWFEQAGIVRVTEATGDPDTDQPFQVVERTGDVPVVMEPAYVDQATGRVLRPGRLRYTKAATGAAPPEEEDR